MNVSRLDQLSDRQRQCLRLLFANLSIKEVGRDLNLSPNTVRGHLRDARRILGAGRSMQAARMLVEYERDTLGIDPPNRIGPTHQLSHDVVAAAAGNPVPAVRNRYNLTVLQRIVLIAFIAFLSVALAGALLIGSEAINRFFWNHQVDLSDPPYR